MVPRAERKTSGVGDKDFRPSSHFELSVSTTGLIFGVLVERFLRVMAWTVSCEGKDARVVRIWDP